MGGIKTISIIVAANIKGLEASLGKANKSIASFASNAARMGSILSFGVTAPLVALGKQAFSTFSQFENAMMKVNTVTGASAEEFKMLTEEAKRLGATTQFTASQVAELQLVLGRKGFDPTQIKNMEKSILDLALATGEDLSLAADTVASSINAFGLASDEASSVANTLASAAANSSIQLSTFSTAFGHAGASAKAVGVDIEELSAMMGVLMDNGIKASKAGTGLRKAFMELNEQGVPFGETLERLSNGTLTLNQAQRMVGKTGANQLLILSQNKDKIAELTNEYKTNTTRLDEMAEAMGSTTQGKILKMNSAFESLQIEMGGLIAEYITPLIQKLTQIANKFTALDDGTKRSIIKFAAMAAAIGPVLIAVGALVGVVGNLGLALKKVAMGGFSLLFNPMGAVLALSTALAAGIIYLSENWTSFIVTVAKSAKPVRNLVTGLMSAIGKALGPGLGTKLQASAIAIDVLGKSIDEGLTAPPSAEWMSFGDTMKGVISDVLGFDLSSLTDLFKTDVEKVEIEPFEFILDPSIFELEDLDKAEDKVMSFADKVNSAVNGMSNKVTAFFDKWGDGINMVGDIFGQMMENQSIALENRHKEQMEAIMIPYEQELANIENSMMSEEQKAEAKRALDEKNAADVKALEEKTNKA